MPALSPSGAQLIKPRQVLSCGEWRKSKLQSSQVFFVNYWSGYFNYRNGIILVTDYRELRNCEMCLKFHPNAGEKKIVHQLGLRASGRRKKLTCCFLLSTVLVSKQLNTGSRLKTLTHLKYLPFTYITDKAIDKWRNVHNWIL